jgi:hypothetical protein
MNAFDFECYKTKLKDDITKLEIQKSNSIESLDRIKQKEKDVLSYLPFFNNLEEMLWDNYSIKIKDYIQARVPLPHDRTTISYITSTKKIKQ